MSAAARDRTDRIPTTPLISKNLESETVRRERHFRDSFHRTRMTCAAVTAHVAEECLHGREFALDVDEDRAIGPVSDGANNTVTTSGFRDSRAVVHALDAAARDALPVDEHFSHEFSRGFRYSRLTKYVRYGDFAVLQEV
jgi:hypothetical protein